MHNLNLPCLLVKAIRLQRRISIVKFLFNSSISYVLWGSAFRDICQLVVDTGYTLYFAILLLDVRIALSLTHDKVVSDFHCQNNASPLQAVNNFGSKIIKRVSGFISLVVCTIVLPITFLRFVMTVFLKYLACPHYGLITLQM